MGRSDTRDDLPVPPWVPVLVVAGVALAAIYSGLRYGPGPAILVLASAALIGVVWLTFRAMQSISEPGDDDELASAPTPAESQKQSALRALKDLEYERSVGNIADADYAQLVGRYRDEAKRAMRLVDEERAELRAAAEDIAKRAIAKLDDEPYRDAKPLPEVTDADKPERHECVKCGLVNDEDARFCKKCGAPLATPEVAS